MSRMKFMLVHACLHVLICIIYKIYCNFNYIPSKNDHHMIDYAGIGKKCIRKLIKFINRYF